MVCIKHVPNGSVSGVAVGVNFMGAMLATSGLFGFCPRCAMAGRKPDKKV